jgi:serine/threonine protein kinase
VLRGRYELRRLLGEGGMSCVWEAIDHLRDARGTRETRVALKVLRPSLAGRPDAVQALHLEFERAQRLSHPAIVNVLGLDADGDIHFITMERLEGELLGEVIKRLRPATLRRDHAFAILARLGDAVAFAHEAGIVHADVKPGNVMLTLSGELRLFDFGAAWPAQREPWIYEAGERSLQGATPTYASAERLGGAAPTVRDDVFSFCCLAYELLAGRHPFDRQPAHEAQRNGLRPARIPGLSRRQWLALKRGLAFGREDRWPDMRMLLRELLPPEAARESLPIYHLPEPRARSAPLSGLTMLLLGAAAFAIAHWASSGLPAPLQDFAVTVRETAISLLDALR